MELWVKQLMGLHTELIRTMTRIDSVRLALSILLRAVPLEASAANKNNRRNRKMFDCRRYGLFIQNWQQLSLSMVMVVVVLAGQQRPPLKILSHGNDLFSSHLVWWFLFCWVVVFFFGQWRSAQFIVVVWRFRCVPSKRYTIAVKCWTTTNG